MFLSGKLLEKMNRYYVFRISTVFKDFSKFLKIRQDFSQRDIRIPAGNKKRKAQENTPDRTCSPQVLQSAICA